jgi:hypothetical protein
MSNEPGYASKYFQAAIHTAGFGLLFWIIGYLFLLVTRLFIRPSKVPSALEGIAIGLAVIWAIWLCGFMKTDYDIANDKPKTSFRSPYGYDYDLHEKYVLFSYVPKKPSIYYNKIWRRMKEMSTQNVYLVQDKRNPKKFFISSKKDSVVYPKYIKESGEELKSLVRIDNEGVWIRAKEKMDRQTWNWTWIFGICGIICYLHAQLSAIFGESFDQFENGVPDNPIPISFYSRTAAPPEPPAPPTNEHPRLKEFKKILKKYQDKKKECLSNKKQIENLKQYVAKKERGENVKDQDAEEILSYIEGSVTEDTCIEMIKEYDKKINTCNEMIASAKAAIEKCYADN